MSVTHGFSFHQTNQLGMGLGLPLSAALAGFPVNTVAILVSLSVSSRLQVADFQPKGCLGETDCLSAL